MSSATTPADKDTWEYAKVLFDDGEMALLASPTYSGPAAAGAAFNSDCVATSPVTWIFLCLSICPRGMNILPLQCDKRTCNQLHRKVQALA